MANNVLEKDIYVELELRALRGGVEWNSIRIRYPKQSEAMYFVLEGALSKALLEIGAELGQDVLVEKSNGNGKTSV